MAQKTTISGAMSAYTIMITLRFSRAQLESREAAMFGWPDVQTHAKTVKRQLQIISYVVRNVVEPSSPTRRWMDAGGGLCWSAFKNKRMIRKRNIILEVLIVDDLRRHSQYVCKVERPASSHEIHVAPVPLDLMADCFLGAAPARHIRERDSSSTRP
jgi:hypothetical protein